MVAGKKLSIDQADLRLRMENQALKRKNNGKNQRRPGCIEREKSGIIHELCESKVENNRILIPKVSASWRIANRSAKREECRRHDRIISPCLRPPDVEAGPAGTSWLKNTFCILFYNNANPSGFKNSTLESC